MAENPAVFGMFSNNNYMPAIGHCAAGYNRVPVGVNQDSNLLPPPVVHAVLPPLSGSLHNSVYHPGLGTCAQNITTGFTFTAPTQSSSFMASQPNVGLNSFHHHTCMTPIMAPGVGVTWQHTVPSPMPWVQSSVAAASTDHMFSTPFTCSFDPKPSCSCAPRRPKRRASSTSSSPDLDPPVSKIFLTEERMAAEMQNLYITASESNMMKTVYSKQAWHNTLSANTGNNHLYNGWKQLKLLEDRLVDEEDDVVDDKVCGTIHITKQFRQEPVLPRKILEEIAKPCLDIVLWKPPEVLANNDKEMKAEDIHQENSECALPLSDISVNSHQMSSVITTPFLFKTDDSMEL